MNRPDFDRTGLDGKNSSNSNSDTTFSLSVHLAKGKRVDFSLLQQGYRRHTNIMTKQEKYYIVSEVLLIPLNGQQNDC